MSLLVRIASVKLGNTGIFLQQNTQNDTKKFHGNNDVFYQSKLLP